MLLPVCEETCYVGLLPIIMLSVSFAMFFPTIWAIIPDITPSRASGTAFGLSYSAYNFGQLIVPLIGSSIHDHTLEKNYGYFWVRN